MMPFMAWTVCFLCCKCNFPHCPFQRSTEGVNWFLCCAGCGPGARWAPPAVQLHLLVLPTDPRAPHQLPELRAEHQTDRHLRLRECPAVPCPWHSLLLPAWPCVLALGTHTAPLTAPGGRQGSAKWALEYSRGCVFSTLPLPCARPLCVVVAGIIMGKKRAPCSSFMTGARGERNSFSVLSPTHFSPQILSIWLTVFANSWWPVVCLEVMDKE